MQKQIRSVTPFQKHSERYGQREYRSLFSSSPFNLQFFHWKRVHFQVIFERGVKTRDQPLGYRWIAAEPDDIGEPNLPAESYEAFDVRPLSTGNAADSIFFAPKDKKTFITEKESAEFKECPTHSPDIRKKFADHWRGKRVTDAGEIRKYMTSIMAVKRLVRPYGIRSWTSAYEKGDPGDPGIPRRT